MSLNIFYTNYSGSEEHFFKNDVFNQDLYNYKINFMFFGNDTHCDIYNEYKNMKNIIVLNSTTELLVVDLMINLLQPSILIHISDECGNHLDHYELYKKRNIKHVFHHYKNKHLNFGENFYQIPLGYVKYYLSDKSSINNLTINQKEYDFSFVGSMKSDRKEMLHAFMDVFDNFYISAGLMNWSSPLDSTVKTNEIYSIYSKSIFVPIGRGNVSLDCFRIYEAILAGAIPVIVGPKEEIDYIFSFNGNKPLMICGNSWTVVAAQCKHLSQNKEIVDQIIIANKQWWNSQIIYIANKIQEIIA